MSDLDSEVETDKSLAESDQDENNADVTEDQRQNIRDKLSSLSFEDLLKMKEQMGSKVYNETVFGVNSSKKKTQFKRVNKNRPREMSSKIRMKQIKLNASNASTVKKQISRDPRFDPLCGSFDDKTFKSNYKFLKDVRKTEKKELEKEYSDCTDPERKKKIKYLIQRMDNQIREQEKKEKVDQKAYEEKKEIRDKLRHGEKPAYKKKSVKKLESLIEKYEELKKTNKLQKHIEKRSKKLAQKEKRKMKNLDTF